MRLRFLHKHTRYDEYACTNVFPLLHPVCLLAYLTHGGKGKESNVAVCTRCLPCNTLELQEYKAGLLNQHFSSDLTHHNSFYVGITGPSL